MNKFFLISFAVFALQLIVVAQEGWWTRANGLKGTEFVGWTKVNGDTSTFYWNTKPVERWRGDMATLQEEIYTFDDYRVTIDTTSSGGLYARWYDIFTGISYDTTFHLPLKVEVVTDPNNPIDVSGNTWLMEFNVTAPWNEYRKYYYSQLGWDLVPGGLAYTQGSPEFYERYIDILNFEKYEINSSTGDTTFTGLLLQTNHQPDTYINAYGDTVYINAVAPSHGDEFTIKTIKLKNLNSVYFITEEVGWAAGGYTSADSSNGFMVRTSDEGGTWDPQEVPQYEITSAYFVNPYLGWASTRKSEVMTGNCVILKTTNGGDDWVINLELINQELYDVFFIDNDFGWVVGSNGLIYRTNDGGENWSPGTSGTNVILRSVYFNDYSTGWVVGDRGVILNTTNFGVNWSPQTSGTNKSLKSVQFVNQNTGWAVGDSSTILKTTDGGEHWLPKDLPGFSFTSVDFIDETNGWITGNNNSGTNGVILNTADGGDNWKLQAETKRLKAIQFIGQNFGWAVGDSSSIYHTINGGVSSVESEETDKVVTSYHLNQNYPNPFNPSTKIRFTISNFGFTILKVYDLLGREVATLLNEEKPSGIYEVEWNAAGLPSGVYFYQLRADGFVETKKMILMK